MKGKKLKTAVGGYFKDKIKYASMWKSTIHTLFQYQSPLFEKQTVYKQQWLRNHKYWIQV